MSKFQLKKMILSPVLSPVCKNIWKVLTFPTISVYSNAGLHLFRTYSVLNRMAEPQWQTAKTKLLKLSLEERRKLYKIKDYVILDVVDPWCHYVLKNENIETKKHTLDDVTEFKKIKVNAAMHEELAKRVSIFKGDITKLEVDAIVNAANSFLRAGGGVDGVIHRGAGPFLQEECNTLGGCPTGDAKITGAYTLPAKYVIHTVGPQDGSPSKLESCYQKCLSFQKEYDLRSIAFPCISTGIYGFPNRLAAHIALRTARKFLENNKRVERIIFCTFMPIDVDIYETLLQMYFPVHEWNYNDSSTGTD